MRGPKANKEALEQIQKKLDQCVSITDYEQTC